MTPADTHHAATVPSYASGLTRLSLAIYRLERRVMQLAVGAILFLIVVGIAMTALGAPLYWVNEAAISLMLFATFLGQSMLTHTGAHPAVTIVTELAGPKRAPVLERMVDALLFMMALFLIFLAWRLFDPLGVVRSGFDTMRYAIDNQNFIYQEPTNTLGIAKAWIWAAPVPTFFGCAIHSVARLIAGHVAQHHPEAI